MHRVLPEVEKLPYPLFHRGYFSQRGFRLYEEHPHRYFLGASWKARPRLAPALAVRDKYVTKVQVNINIHIFKGKLYRKKLQVLDCFLLCPFDHDSHSHAVWPSRGRGRRHFGERARADNCDAVEDRLYR